MRGAAARGEDGRGAPRAGAAVMGWGAGTEGQLARRDKCDAHSPAVVPVGRPIVLALGGAHAVAVIGAPADPLVTNYNLQLQTLICK